MILETSDYSIFQKHAANRNIDKANLHKIINSIKARNLLYLRPIIVNKNFEIIDGQHRLEAAKYLELPVFYQIQPEAVDEDIILLNDNMKRWTIDDYLNYYLSKGNIEYTKLNEFIKRNNIDLSIALVLLGRNGKLSINFRSGSFKFPDNIVRINNNLFMINEVKQFIILKGFGPKLFLQRNAFTKTLISFLNIEGMLFDKFMTKLELNLQWLRPCTSYTDYMNIFKKIYNYKNPHPI